MSKDDSTLDAIAKLLELAREFEKKNNIQSALMTYNHALSQLPAESPLKKEIEIIILHLEGRSVFAGGIVPPKNTNQLWRIGTAFLVGLSLMGVIAFAVINFSASPHAIVATKTITQTYVAPNDTTSTPTQIISQQNTANVLETAEPVQNIFLTIKSKSVYLRAGPDMKQPEISKAYQRGIQMDVLGKYNDWFYVKSSSGETGWLFKDFVNIDPSLVNLVPIMTPGPTSAIPTPEIPYANP